MGQKLKILLLISSILLIPILSFGATDYTQDSTCWFAILADADPGVSTSTPNSGAKGGNMNLTSAGNPDWVASTTDPGNFSDGYFTYTSDKTQGPDWTNSWGFSNTSGSSATCWFAITDSDIGNWNRLCSTHNNAIWWISNSATPNAIIFTVFVSGTQKHVTSGSYDSYTDGVFWFTAETLDSSHILRRYINGVQQGSDTDIGGFGDDAAWMYMSGNNVSSLTMDGIDELSMFSGKCLTSTEVNEIMDFGLNGSGTSTAIKTINGLAIGSVKTYNGLAIGSVKTINGASSQ